MDDFKLTEEIHKLREAVDRLNRRMSLGYGFIHGIFVGLGTTIGVAIIFALFGFVIQRLLAPHLPFVQQNLDSVLELLQLQGR